MEKYIQYIPLDFYEKNKTRMYAKKARCIKAEGSAYGFDYNEVQPMFAKFENGVLVKDEEKIKAEKIKVEEEKNNLWKGERKAAYQTETDNLMVEIQADEILGKDTKEKRKEFKKLQADIKKRFPKT